MSTFHRFSTCTKPVRIVVVPICYSLRVHVVIVVLTQHPIRVHVVIVVPAQYPIRVHVVIAVPAQYPIRVHAGQGDEDAVEGDLLGGALQQGAAGADRREGGASQLGEPPDWSIS